MEKFEIKRARKKDANFLAEAIIAAIGPEHCAEIIGGADKLPGLKEIFAELAASEDSQYSYNNALCCLDNDGNVIGACIIYDGAQLHRLREPFLKLAAERLQMDTSNVADETDASEFYLDTLMVLPQWRGKGIASKLILASVERAREAGKPVGLLVAFDNPKANALYERCGFRSVGTRSFLGVDMLHMVKR